MASPIDDETFCSRAFATDDTPVDAQAAYRRFHAQRNARYGWPRYAAAWASAAAAALLMAAAFTPLGSYARSFLTIFEPQQFTPIDVSTLKRHGDLPLQLDAFGTLHSQRFDVRPVALADVDRVAGFHVLRPAYLPPHLPPSTGYKVAHRVTDRFTFDAKKARRTEARIHDTLPPVPPAIDGTTVTVDAGPFVERTWSEKREEPTLAIAQVPVPVVRSSGASLAQLERYLLRMPGVTPQFAVQIRAISDPASTLPVPIRFDKQSARAIAIHGAQGLTVGDNTGAGATVMWQSHGMLYIVGGTLPQDDVIAIANGLR